MKIHPLSKSEVLTGKTRFDELFNQGTFIRGKLVNIIFQKADSFKIAFAVSGKIRIHAKRNKLKRHLREIYRTNKKEFPSAIHLILIIKKENYKYFELQKEVLSRMEAI